MSRRWGRGTLLLGLLCFALLAMTRAARPGSPAATERRPGEALRQADVRCLRLIQHSYETLSRLGR